MKTKLIILAVVLMLVGGVGYYYSNSTVGWETYVGEEYGFEFKYPSGGELNKITSTYVEIKNFTPLTEYEEMDDGNYYIRIYLGQKVCNVINKTELPAELGAVYTGLSDMESGIGGLQSKLCGQKDETLLSIVVNEPDSKGDLAKRIFSTFKFTK